MKSNRKIYLDWAASATPNPSSIHELGVAARRKLESARKAVAEVLGARAQEVIFTSGGTESNNLAILGLILASKNTSFVPHVVTTNIEHPSVFETVKVQAEFTIVPVESNGIVDAKKIKQAIKKNTVLVSVMYANNEIGTVQPIREIAKGIRHYKKNNKRDNIFFHTDAVQAANYLDLNVLRLGVDMLTLSGSKIPGAGRVGVLYKKTNVPLRPILHGGDQERGIRPGTENLDAILEFSSAFVSTQKNKKNEGEKLAKLKKHFINSLIQLNKGIVLNGDQENSLPSIVSITFPGIPSDLIVIELSARGIMSSSKSACKSSSQGNSHVIEAINPELDQGVGAVRFSFGKDTSRKDIDHTLAALKEILTKLKKWYN